MDPSNAAQPSTLERELQYMLTEMLNANNDTRQAPRYNRRYSFSSAEDYRHNYQEREPDTDAQMIRILGWLINDYRATMRDYGENMGLILQLMQGSRTFRPTNNREQSAYRRQNAVPQRSTDAEPFMSYMFYPLSSQNNTRAPANRFSNVIVRPTTLQIASATRMVSYSVNEEFGQTRCPITLEEFHEGDSLCQIIHCGHIFKEDAIRNWFASNVRCPVCRYDIRDFSLDATVEEPDDEPVGISVTPRSNTPQLTGNAAVDNLTNILRNYIENELLLDTSYNITSMTYTIREP